jgi:alanyl-tRNA synthetase
MMNSDEIRQAFLSFFEGKQHKIIPSSSLVPHGDPTLLLTTAGMVQIKPYFLGLSVPPHTRITSCQKCFRTTDIDSVGDSKHLTFFEMLGNFSVGDYFKKEAITLAWEFVNKRLKMAPERLWITVYLDDDEAFAYWKSIGIPEDKIVRLGERDNFWGPPGDSGPCGPCSEIHYDFGEKYGCGKSDCKPGCECGRFSEIWNLVFTQYNQDHDGNRTPLPKPNIDTGMGLERTTAVMQGVYSVYDTDIFSQLRSRICDLTGNNYGKNEAIDQSIRIVCEHSRGIVFLIADGVLPSNEGRGYVLRRILRKASFFGRKLGIKEPFLGEMAEVVVNKMSQVYDELNANRNFILEVIQSEEEKFIATLDAGINLVEKTIAETNNQGRKYIEGKEIFRLYDTYGFPAELTAEIAKERGLTLDLKDFHLEMEKQRDKARSSHKFVAEADIRGNKEKIVFQPTEFVGYEKLKSTAKIIGLLDQDSLLKADFAIKGTNVALILDKTPYYGEMGGQIGDEGKMVNASGVATITNAIRSPFANIAEGVIVHLGRVTGGKIAVGDTVEATVETERRLDIARNHTATHLLHSALRQVIGSHISQRGSLVNADRLRFDFSHLTIISKEQMREIQYIVNSRIRENLPVTSKIVPYKQAIAEGAIALFEEKYGDTVRLMAIGEPRISAELCGGTHIKATGEIGYFHIVNEGSIGTGLRRIEAITGRGAGAFIEERINILEATASEIKSSSLDVYEKIKILMNELTAERKRIIAMERRQSKNMIDDLIAGAGCINGITLITAQIPSSSISVLRELGDSLRERLQSAVIVLGTVNDDKPGFIAIVTPDLIKKGLHAGEIIKKVAGITGGSGGGKPEMAQAGGKDKNKIDQALESVKEIIEKAG